MKMCKWMSCVVLSAWCGAQASGAVPLVTLPFDEGARAFADTTVGEPRSAVLSSTAKWAIGPFGTALATGETAAHATVGTIPELNGDKPFTIFVRFRFTGNSSGPHSAILSTSDWGRGGLLFYTANDALMVRMRAGAKGPENGLTVFGKMPKDAWCSVALVYARPLCRIYANGKRVLERKWDYAFRACDFTLGGWGRDSFGGLIDDFRVWQGALDDAAIKELAEDSRYAEVEGYQDDGTGGVGKITLVDQFSRTAKPVAAFANEAVTMGFDASGAIVSLREKSSGRELVSNIVPFVTCTCTNGNRLVPRSFERLADNRLVWHFPFKRGDIEMNVTPFTGGWRFRVTACTLQNIRSVNFAAIKPVCTEWKGTFVNAFSDAQSAVCVRSGDYKAEPVIHDDTLSVRVQTPFDVVGRTAFVAAGPRTGFIAQLRAMTEAAGVPKSDCGGAWSMGSEVSRWSYVFAPVRKGDIDDWINLTKRAGFSHIHIDSSWTHCLGQCPINPNAFPDGLMGMKQAADRVHAAGLHVGMHTLTACINPRDSWITPVCSTNLVADATYTLAAPLGEKDTELRVMEKPIAKHAIVFTYSCNGNVLRLGNELIQYTGIQRDTQPYAFTGIKRGAFGTRKNAGTISAGTPIDYLHQRYIAFYPAPDSPLADQLADRLAEVYNTCGLDELYFDGSEGMGTRYGVDAMRHKIYARLKHNNGHSPSVEASCQGANNWWFQTRTATTDHGVYGVKRFHDFHIDWGVRQGRLINFMEPQMGWWQPRTDVPRARGHFLDEMEYFAGKNAGHDAAMSLQGLRARPLPIGIRRQLTVLGWYEYPRLARVLAPGVQQHLAGTRTEARLRQDEDGVWQLEDIEEFKHRAGFAWTRQTTFTSTSERPAYVRVEALYSAAPAGSGTALLQMGDVAQMASGAAPGVKSQLLKATAGEHGTACRLVATNQKAPQNGAWARARKTFPFPGANVGKDRLAYGVWVKGDGSGALLNLQLEGVHEYNGGISDHYVRLNFTGWRYITFLLRERDAGEFWKYVWPYGGGYAPCYRSMIGPDHIAAFAIYLNDIPVGKTASVEVGTVEALDQVPGPALANAELCLNEQHYPLPFALKAGEYAELAAGTWTHYSALGKALAAVPFEGAEPHLKAGANTVDVQMPTAARAEVTLFAHSNRREAFQEDWTAAQQKQMRYEAVMPFVYAPEQGLLPPAVLPVRKGGKARLEVEIYGPAKNPAFTFSKFFGLSSDTYTFPVTLATDEKLECTDGAAWRVVKSTTGAEVAQGTLPEAMPLLTKSIPLSFTAELVPGQACEVDLLKTYVQP